jgi:hypothetical protein
MMINQGLDKSGTQLGDSFGDWATESEFSWVDRPIQRRPAETSNTDKNKIASRRAAAYWESRK